MLAIAETLITFHGWARWLAIAAASWMLALASVQLVRRRRAGALERRSLTVLTGVLHGQVGLGVIIALLLTGAGAPPFEGRSATLFGHALGGVLMAACATLAIILSRRAATPRVKGLWLTVCVGLAWVLLGKWVISVPILVVAVIVALTIRRRAVAPDVEIEPTRNAAG